MILPEPAPRIWVTGPELVVLEKLRWFQMQDGVSDRQWRDILGVLKGVGRDLDLAWMRVEADHDGTLALLEKAWAQAGPA